MDTELLDKLLKVGADLIPDTYRDAAEPNYVYFRRTKDGGYERTRAEPQPRSHVAASLDAIAELAATSRGKPEIWHSCQGVTLFLDGGDRRDSVKMPLDLSPQIQRLQMLESQRPGFQQGGVIKELRITFAGCLTGNLVDLLRRVKFNATQDTDSVVQHGKVSLGKKITSEVTGTDVLPDDFTLTVPVFANPRFADIRFPVKVAMEPDATTCTFQLIPLPGQVAAAVSNGEFEIQERIVELLKEKDASNTAVYHGKA